jgi:hypothetical protein
VLHIGNRICIKNKINKIKKSITNCIYIKKILFYFLFFTKGMSGIAAESNA